MAKKDPRVDAYIEKAQPFAKPILKKLRTLVHKGCPPVEESIKWGIPHFDYEGGILASMGAFKAHAVFGFWRAMQLKDAKEFRALGNDGMGQLGKITSVGDLPPDAKLLGWVKEAMALTDAGAPTPVARKAAMPKSKTFKVPKALSDALEGNAKAKKTFDAFPPGKRRDYADWIAEAKTDDTREKRLATAVEWMAEGKSRNWKYEAKKK